MEEEPGVLYWRCGTVWRDCSLVVFYAAFIPSCGFLWDGQFDMNRVLVLTGVIAFIFLLRILIYSYGYTKAQIGGAKVSKNIRLFMGDHLKRIPLSRFTQGRQAIISTPLPVM